MTAQTGARGISTRLRRLGSPLLVGYFVLLLCICLFLWTSFVQSRPARFDAIGWDFLNLYTGADMALHGRPVYDLNEQIAWQANLIQPHRIASQVLPFVYPPMILPLVIPFAMVPLRQSYYLWMAGSVVLLGLFLLLMQRHLKLVRHELVILSLGVLSFYPLSIHLWQGQSSLIVLLGITLGYLALRKGEDFWGGVALALGSVKPQLIVPLVLVLLMKRRWKTMGGFLGGVAALLLPTWPLLGPLGMVDYTRFILSSLGWNQQYGMFPETMQNLRALSRWLVGNGPLQLVLLSLFSLAGLAVLVWVWRGKWQPREPRFPLQFAATILLTTLLSPHLYIHDLTLWLLPGALLAYAAPPLAGKAHAARVILILSGAGVGQLIPTFMRWQFPLAVPAAVAAVGLLVVLLSPSKDRPLARGRAGLEENLAGPG